MYIYIYTSIMARAMHRRSTCFTNWKILSTTKHFKRNSIFQKTFDKEKEKMA